MHFALRELSDLDKELRPLLGVYSAVMTVMVGYNYRGHDNDDVIAASLIGGQIAWLESKDMVENLTAAANLVKSKKEQLKTERLFSQQKKQHKNANAHSELATAHASFRRILAQMLASNLEQLVAIGPWIDYLARGLEQLRHLLQDVQMVREAAMKELIELQKRAVAAQEELYMHARRGGASDWLLGLQLNLTLDVVLMENSFHGLNKLAVGAICLLSQVNEAQNQRIRFEQQQIRSRAEEAAKVRREYQKGFERLRAGAKEKDKDRECVAVMERQAGERFNPQGSGLQVNAGFFVHKLAAKYFLFWFRCQTTKLTISLVTETGIRFPRYKSYLRTYPPRVGIRYNS